MPYEFLDDVATADIAFKASGSSLEETFREASEALMNVMVEELGSIEPREQRRIRLENENFEMLLFDFLQEFIYYKDSEVLLLRTQGIRVGERNGEVFLQAELAGEPIDLNRHHSRVDVKAVTMHQFRLEKKDNGWEAFAILDI